MPRFICSYAYDLSCFADFTVEAPSERAAQQRIQQALKAGRFTNVECSSAYDNEAKNHRVFVLGPARPDDHTDNLDELIGPEIPAGPTRPRPWRVVEQDGGLWQLFGRDGRTVAFIWDGGRKVAGMKRHPSDLYFAYRTWNNSPPKRSLTQSHHFMRLVGRLLRWRRLSAG